MWKCAVRALRSRVLLALFVALAALISGATSRPTASACHPATASCDELFFIWLRSDYDPLTTTEDKVLQASYSYVDYKVICAIEAATKAARHSKTRVVVYTEIPNTEQFLEEHSITEVAVRYLTDDYIQELVNDTPLKAWYEGFRLRPRFGWHGRRLHLSNALRLAILYHKGGLWLDMDAIVLRDDTLEVLPSCMAMQSHMCSTPNGGAIRIVGSRHHVIHDHMVQYPATYARIRLPAGSTPSRPRLGGAGSAILTTTQGDVYSAYGRDRLTKLGGQSPQAEAGYWEEMSCQYKLVPRNATGQTFYYLPQQTMYPVGIGGPLKRATQYGDRKGAAQQWKLWKTVGVFINHYWSKVTDGGVYLANGSFWGLMMEERCPVTLNGVRSGSLYTNVYGQYRDERQSQALKVLSESEYDRLSERMCQGCTVGIGCGWTCCPTPPCWGKYEERQLVTKAHHWSNETRYLVFKRADDDARVGRQSLSSEELKAILREDSA
mmetsp:Transcript_2912/g.10539  ORF Transcript_2912/g.10539 Transcript_2912/m.10539 type:complete len:493 (-) Transcript_2912:1496-2974(-)